MISVMLQRLKICCLALAFALGLCSANAMAKDLVTERAIFEDATGQMTLAQVKQAVFAPTPVLVNQGFSRSAFWIRLKVDVPNGSGPLAIRLQPTLLDKATLYYPAAQSPEGEVEQHIDARSAQKETQVSLQPGVQTIYLRAETIGAVLIQAQVLTPEGAVEQDGKSQMMLGALMSVYAMLGALMLGLMLLRKETFRFFFFFHLAVCLAHYLLVLDILGPHTTWAWAFGRTATRFSSVFNFLSFFLLMQSLLGYFKMPRMHRWTRCVVAIFGLLVVLFFVTDRHLVLKISALMGAITTLTMMLIIVFLLTLYARNTQAPIGVKLLTCSLVSLFVATVTRSMLQLLGVFEGGAFLLESPALRGIFIPLGLLAFLWQRDQAQSKKLFQRQIDQAVSEVKAKDLAQRLATQSQFIAMLMHELKTPLYTIQLAVSSLTKHVEVASPDVTRLNNINRSVDDLNFIIERCVEADQLEQSDLPVKKTPVALGTLLNELTREQDHERLSFTGVAEAKLSTDYQYARIILLNLITNALKYSPPQSVVTVDVLVNEKDTVPSLCLRISNQVGSAGRPDPDKVFNRYYRAEGARKEVGAGLGLWLAQSIALKLGSHLRCTSDDDMVHFLFFLELS